MVFLYKYLQLFSAWQMCD